MTNANSSRSEPPGPPWATGTRSAPSPGAADAGGSRRSGATRSRSRLGGAARRARPRGRGGWDRSGVGRSTVKERILSRQTRLTNRRLARNAMHADVFHLPRRRRRRALRRARPRAPPRRSRRRPRRGLRRARRRSPAAPPSRSCSSLAWQVAVVGRLARPGDARLARRGLARLHRDPGRSGELWPSILTSLRRVRRRPGHRREHRHGARPRRRALAHRRGARRRAAADAPRAARSSA